MVSALSLRDLARRPRALACALCVALFLVVALHSAVRTWPTTWDAFRGEVAHWRVTPPPASLSAASAPAGGVDPAVIDFYAAHLRAGDRYAFELPRKPPLPPPVEQGLLEVAAINLLPAVRVERVRDATVLLTYGVLPAGRATARLPGHPVAVVRLRR